LPLTNDRKKCQSGGAGDTASLMYTYTPAAKVLRVDHALAPKVDGT
jgi:hypothetical protein